MPIARARARETAVNLMENMFLSWSMVEERERPACVLTCNGFEAVSAEKKREAKGDGSTLSLVIGFSRALIHHAHWTSQAPDFKLAVE
jgi:hypothetical protein